MSPSASQRPDPTAARWLRAVADPPQESLDDLESGERVAREVRHELVIEASFDRAEAYARLGDFGRALEWLDHAAAVSGGLTPAYRQQRAHWVRAAAVPRMPAGGERRKRAAATTR
jgi:hypothetical protein